MSFGRLKLGDIGKMGAGGTTTPADPLAPPAPTLDLVAGSDSGSSSTDNITSDTTPDLDIILGQLPAENDVIKIYDNGVEIASHTVTALEAGSGTISLGLSALSEAVHSLTARHNSGAHVGIISSALSITVLTTAPTITTSSTANCAENATLSIALEATSVVTTTYAWSITGGADQARYEISGSTLRWASNGTKNYESPNDADTNNTYIVQVTATDPAGNATNKTITVTVTDVNEAPTVANALVDQTAGVSTAFTYQFASNSFADVDAGNSFTYSAALVAGGSLPAWLTFTSGTRTFSGTPTSGDIGTVSIRVTATDSGSLTVTDDFDIVVSLQSSREFQGGGVFFNQVTTGSRQWQSGNSYNVET